MLRLKEEEKTAEEEKNAQQIRASQIEQEAVRVREQIRDGSEFMEAWQQQYDRMTGLLKVYRAEGAVQLKEALFDCYRKLSCDIEDRQRKEKALREKIRQLEEGGLLNVPEDVQNFMDYIRTCHGVTCVYGAQYLQEAEETERCGLLRKDPVSALCGYFEGWFFKSSGGCTFKGKGFW